MADETYEQCGQHISNIWHKCPKEQGPAYNPFYRPDNAMPPLTREEALEDWREKMDRYNNLYKLWKEGGMKGEPPPRPVRPHTPGRAQ